MKKQPIPKNIPTIQWDAKEGKSLKEALSTLYTKIAKGEDKALDRTPSEAKALIDLLENKTEDIKEVENLSQEELLTRRLSLWAEQPERSQAAVVLGEAAPEVETAFLLQRDLVEVELHRRK